MGINITSKSHKWEAEAGEIAYPKEFPVKPTDPKKGILEHCQKMLAEYLVSMWRMRKIIISNLHKYMRRLSKGGRKLSYEHSGQIHHLCGSHAWQICLLAFPSPWSHAWFRSSLVISPSSKLVFLCCQRCLRHNLITLVPSFNVLQEFPSTTRIRLDTSSFRRL